MHKDTYYAKKQVPVVGSCIPYPRTRAVVMGMACLFRSQNRDVRQVFEQSYIAYDWRQNSRWIQFVFNQILPQQDLGSGTIPVARNYSGTRNAIPVGSRGQGLARRRCGELSLSVTYILYWIEALSVIGDPEIGLKTLKGSQAKLSVSPRFILSLAKTLSEILHRTERFLLQRNHRHFLSQNGGSVLRFLGIAM